MLNIKFSEAQAISSYYFHAEFLEEVLHKYPYSYHKSRLAIRVLNYRRLHTKCETSE